MGMTSLEGVTMVARSGSVDPAILIWLLRDQRLNLDELDDGLNRRSGLAGAGRHERRPTLPTRRCCRNARLAVYIHRLSHGVSAMAGSLDGIDVLAFTGGVGQHGRDRPRASRSR